MEKKDRNSGKYIYYSQKKIFYIKKSGSQLKTPMQPIQRSTSIQFLNESQNKSITSLGKLSLVIRALPAAIRQHGGIVFLLKKVRILIKTIGFKQTIHHVLNYAAKKTKFTMTAWQSWDEFLTRGALETFCLTPSDFKPIDKARIVVHIHAYYVNLFEEICLYLKNIPVKHTLLISVKNKEDQLVITEQIKKLPLVRNAIVKVVQNRGRDIAPMLVDFATEIKENDYICHIHTKQSSYTDKGDEWRRYLYDMLLGSKERVQAIFSVFKSDPSVGLIYPDTFYSFPYWGNTWLRNKQIAPSLLIKLGVRYDPDAYLDFPVGSMFWAQRKAIEPLLNLGLTKDDFTEEHGQTDGTLHHTIERSFVLVAQSKGFKHAVIQDREAHHFSFRDSKNLHHYLSVPVSLKLRLGLPTADVVSFDIFDTLLTRPFASPDMVFSFLEEQIAKKFGIKGFCEMRKEAENVVRAGKDFQGDVKISEIYSVLAKIGNITTATVNQLLELEVNTETALLVPRENIIKLAKEVKDTGKRVILVSDTYLERKYIEKILMSKGIDFYDELYISCETGRRKDRGDLWDYILEREGLEKNKLLHTGDNEQSDIHMLTERFSMQPVHVMKPSVIFQQSILGEFLSEVLKPYKGWRQSLLYGMIANLYCMDPNPKRIFDSEEPLSDPFAFGYVVFGPIIYNFLSWLIKKSTEDDIKQLKFIAREGFLLNQAFKTMVTHPCVRGLVKRLPQGEYFLCSRRAALFATLKEEKDIPLLLEKHFNGTLKAFFEKRLVVSNMVNIERRLGTDALRQVVSLPRDYNLILTSIKEVFDILLRQAKNEREAMLQYYAEQGIAATEGVGLVDLGYSGTIQKSLIKLLDHHLYGYYFVTEHTVKSLHSQGVTCRAYFGEYVGPFGVTTPILRYSLLMETVLTAPSGQLICFSRGPNGVMPIYKKPGISQKEFPTIYRIHEGILKFVKDMLDLFDSAALDVEFPKDLIQRCYELVVTGELRIGGLKSVLSIEDDYCGNSEIPVLDWYADS